MSITAIVVAGKVKTVRTAYLGKRDKTDIDIWAITITLDDLSDVSFAGSEDDFGPLAVLLNKAVKQNA